VIPEFFNSQYTPANTQITLNDPNNMVLSLYGSMFLAMDWDEQESKLMVFDTFKDDPWRMDLVSANHNNTQLLLYSFQTHLLMHIRRDKTSLEKD